MKTGAPAIQRTPVHIVVIDEYELFRAGMRLLLSRQPGYEVIGEAARRDEALDLVGRTHPDVVLLGISSSNAELDLLPELFAASECTRVLVLTALDNPELHQRAVRLGATGVLSKDKSPEVLIKAIDRVHAGEAWLDRSTTATLLRELSPRYRSRQQDPEGMKISSLTGREREVIKLVGEGLKNKQIAEKLFISDVTVHHHLTSIYSKLEVADRLELLIYAYRKGLADLPH